MEEIYILQDGTSLDISEYSDFEKTKFLLANPKAAKKKDTAKSVVTVSSKKQAQPVTTVKKNGVLKSGDTPSGSKKTFRLANDSDLEEINKSKPTVPTYGAKKKEVYKRDIYDLKNNLAEEKDIDNSSFSQEDNEKFLSAFSKANPRHFMSGKLKKEDIESDINVQNAILNGYLSEDDFVKAGIYESTAPISTLNRVSQKEADMAMKKINRFRSKAANEIEASINIQNLSKTFIHEEYDEGDDFASSMFDPVELSSRNVNLKDFNGFLTERGYKDDFKRFKELELDKTTYTQSYDAKLSLEKKKVQYLNMYINDQLQRDIKKQKLDYEKRTGIDPDTANIDLSTYQDLLKKEAPTLSAKMVKIDEENLEKYNKLVNSKGNVGVGNFLSEVASNGWNGFSRTVSESAASLMGILPGDYFEGSAEAIREGMSVDELLSGTDFRYVTAEGYKTEINGIEYIVGDRGQVYDVTNKVNVTSILPESELTSIAEQARKGGVKDKSISATGTSYQTANVVGDLVWQLALSRGMGNGLKAVGGFTEGLGVLGKTKGFLRSVPIKRGMSESIIAQSTLGFSKGYEGTLKAAREAGLSDKESKELASIASIETGVWYALTAPISPQTKATDMLFGKAKNEVLETMIQAYVVGGKKGFVQSLRSYGKGFLNISGEGMAELFQENIQQAGEKFVINKNINEEAGTKILEDTMSLQEFMDTSVLSFLAGAIIPGAGAARTEIKKTTRQLLGMQAVDRLSSLHTLSLNRDKVVKLLNQQVVSGLYTKQEVEDITGEIEAYTNTANKMPGDISSEAAETILGDVNELSNLEQKKKNLDPAFHGTIDEEISALKEKIQRVYYEDVTKKKNAAIKKIIDSGAVGNIEYNTYDNDSDIKTVLMEEYNYSEAEADSMSKSPGFILTEDNLKNKLGAENVTAGRKVIFINENASFQSGLETTGQHEFLHGVIFETVKNDKEAQILIGKALANELADIQKKIQESGSLETATPLDFRRRFKSYVDKYSKKMELQASRLSSGKITQQQYDSDVSVLQGNQWEEVLTLYSEALSNGTVTYQEDVFVKIGDAFRRALQYLGIKDVKFNSGKDVYNFIKDYNRSVDSGLFGKSLSKLATKGASVDKASLAQGIETSQLSNKKKTEEAKDKAKPKPSSEQSTTTPVDDVKSSLKADRQDPEKFKQEINSNYNKEKWGSNPDNIDNVLWNILEKYEVTIVQIAKGSKWAYLPSYSEIDMVGETTENLIPVIRNFNKEFLGLREEQKSKLIDQGFKKGSKELIEELDKYDAKGYKGKKGLVLENDNLNGYINSLLRFKMMDALKSGRVTGQSFDVDINGETFTEKAAEGNFAASDDMLDDIDTNYDANEEFEQDQSRLSVLLKDPVFGFSDEKGNPIEIETVPFGALYVTDINDPMIPAVKALRKETDPTVIAKLEEQVKNLGRGFELQNKKDISYDEKEELKKLKSFKSYDLSTGMMINTFEAFSVIDKPANIMSEEISREILRSPNIETLEYRNFKEKLSTTSKTLTRRMTFSKSEALDKFMYDNWKLIYGVINNPIDPVSGQSSYASKKLPPRLKQLDKDGNYIKLRNINRSTFLQSYYGDVDAKRIIESNSKNIKEEIDSFEETETNEKTGNNLVPTAYFDRRTALMELFGDVLVLQEARRLIRDESFLEGIKERNVDLYNSLKDDKIRNAVLNDMAKGKSDDVKFSIPEETNSKNSTYLSNISDINKQVLVSRTIDKAIDVARKANKSEIKFKVPDLKGLDDKTISYFLIDKVASGYNDFDFLNKENSTGKLTQEVLEVSDVKFSTYQENSDENEQLESFMEDIIDDASSSYDSDQGVAVNQIIEENKGIKEDKVVSKQTARNRGKNIGKGTLFIPPQDDDFVGLLYIVCLACIKLSIASL